MRETWKSADHLWLLSGIDLIIPKNKNDTLYSLSLFLFIYAIRLFVCLFVKQINEESRRLQLNVPIQFVLSISHRFDIFYVCVSPRFRCLVNVNEAKKICM